MVSDQAEMAPSLINRFACHGLLQRHWLSKLEYKGSQNDVLRLCSRGSTVLPAERMLGRSSRGHAVEETLKP